jgi:enterochelin esterase family protein
VEELMPLLVNDFGVTTQASRTVLIGQSLGGLAAVNAGLKAPQRFGNVLSQSGSFWWPGTEQGQLSGADVIAEAAAVHSQVRFWLEAGALEEGLVEGNRDLYEILSEHGYDVAYREYQGGHDFACWRGGVADGLAALLNHDVRGAF